MSNDNPVPRIVVPANPFWEVFRTFGRDELTGGVVALAATGALEGAFHLTGTSGPWQMWALALAGPIFEKVGFFFWHIKEARDTYRSTPVRYRKELNHYIKTALRGGGKTLLWDLLLHDPMYVGLMMLGMSIHSGTPAWLLVPVAFGLAVVAVAVLEVAINEMRYWLFRHERANGLPTVMNNLSMAESAADFFERETYYDARLYLDPSVDAEKAIETLKNRFLPEQDIHTRHYEDHYYQAELPEYNGRQGRLRVRCRDADDDLGGSKMITVQYIYSRATERAGKGQYRYFPRIKDKFYHTTSSIPAALHVGSRHARLYGCEEPPTRIEFIRRMVHAPEALFIAIDSINDSYRVIEIKAYAEKLPLLIEAMHFVMHHFPALQTTDRKVDLINV